MEQEKYEIVKFVDNGFELEVNVSPSEETVWLTQQQLALLFNTTKQNIGLHIKNIFAEKELDIRTVKDFFTVQMEGSRAVNRNVKVYNLDMVISVGFRVKSQRGIVFRKWATSVLKQYMLKGYAVDQARTLVTNENYLSLLNLVADMKSSQIKLEDRVEKLENKYPELAGKVFYDGQMWDAMFCIEKLISKARRSIVLIDDYVDNQTLDILSRKQDKVSAILVTDDRNTRLTAKEVQSFNDQFGGLEVRYSRKFHDRFLILDDEELYYCGASLKDAGKKVFAIGRIHDSEYLQGILSRI